MMLKISVQLIISLILGLTNEANSQAAICHYSFEYFATSGFRTPNGTYYTCYLSAEIAEFDESIIEIQGDHEIGLTDNDVEWLINYEDHKFKTYSSIFCRKFPNLKIVTLNDVEMKSIDEDSLSNCKEMEHFNVGVNRIGEMSENLLNSNFNLSRFWMENNQLTTLPESFFSHNTEIESLTLNGNRLSFLPSKIFHSLGKIEVLYLNKNKLQAIDPEWFANLHNLLWLDLQKNEILEIPSNAFSSLGNLEQLWLNENGIIFLNSDSFVGLEKLTHLTMDTNEISDLPPQVFNPLKCLQGLYLDSNNLSVLHSDSFDVHNNLTTFWLDGNKINAIDERIFDKISNSVFDMSNNVCTQSLVENRTEISLHLKKCFENYSPRKHIACGKPIMAKGNVIGGTQIQRGSYPWITALFSVKNGRLGGFFCGGTIVSTKKIVTAAHCIHNKKTTFPLLKTEIRVVIGSHDLDKRSEVGRSGHDIQKIYVHQSWNVTSDRYDADIAVLVLKIDIEFGSSIQPICLMESNSNLAKMINGVVVGYGKSEDDTKEHENIPKILEIPIHKNEVCFLANNKLASFSSTRTFCGGSGNGTGVCRGDSGSGVFVTHNGINYLRGVVSSSLYNNASRPCDVNSYAIFTDVLQFIDWINGIPTDILNSDETNDRPIWLK